MTASSISLAFIALSRSLKPRPGSKLSRGEGRRQSHGKVSFEEEKEPRLT
jgi:hypothetical protein